MSGEYPTRLVDRKDVVIVQPVGCDEIAYWGAVDDDPNMVVHVQVLSGSEGDDHWHSYVFSTRAKAENWVVGRVREPTLIDALVIDEPDFGNMSDA